MKSKMQQRLIAFITIRIIVRWRQLSTTLTNAVETVGRRQTDKQPNQT